MLEFFLAAYSMIFRQDGQISLNIPSREENDGVNFGEAIFTSCRQLSFELSSMSSFAAELKYGPEDKEDRITIVPYKGEQLKLFCDALILADQKFSRFSLIRKHAINSLDEIHSIEDHRKIARKLSRCLSSVSISAFSSALVITHLRMLEFTDDLKLFKDAYQYFEDVGVSLSKQILLKRKDLDINDRILRLGISILEGKALEEALSTSWGVENFRDLNNVLKKEIPLTVAITDSAFKAKLKSELFVHEDHLCDRIKNLFNGIYPLFKYFSGNTPLDWQEELDIRDLFLDVRKNYWSSLQQLAYTTNKLRALQITLREEFKLFEDATDKEDKIRIAKSLIEFAKITYLEWRDTDFFIKSDVLLSLNNVGHHLNSYIKDSNEENAKRIESSIEYLNTFMESFLNLIQEGISTWTDKKNIDSLVMLVPDAMFYVSSNAVGSDREKMKLHHKLQERHEKLRNELLLKSNKAPKHRMAYAFSFSEGQHVPLSLLSEFEALQVGREVDLTKKGPQNGLYTSVSLSELVENIQENHAAFIGVVNEQGELINGFVHETEPETMSKYGRVAIEYLNEILNLSKLKDGETFLEIVTSRSGEKYESSIFDEVYTPFLMDLEIASSMLRSNLLFRKRRICGFWVRQGEIRNSAEEIYVRRGAVKTDVIHKFPETDKITGLPGEMPYRLMYYVLVDTDDAYEEYCKIFD